MAAQSEQYLQQGKGVMSIQTLMTYAVNNIMILAAGGLLAVWLGWRVWRKFEQYFQQSRNWGDLVFFAGKAVVIIAVMSYVANTIWTNTKSAVDTAISSGSIGAAAQMAVDLGAAVDYALATGNDVLASSGGDAGLFTASAVAAPLIDGATFTVNAPAAEPPAVTPVAVASAPQATSTQYTVKRGDSMYAIAAKVLGDGNRYLELCRLNAKVVGQDCSRLIAGMVLIMPSGASSESPQYTQWKNSITAWQVKPTPTSGFQAAVVQWTAKATATPAPVYGPVASPQEQATLDAQRWNVSFN